MKPRSRAPRNSSLEVDFVVPRGNRKLALVEAKASATVTPGDALPLERLAQAVDSYATERFVVHRPARPSAAGHALRPGTRAVNLDELLSAL